MKDLLKILNQFNEQIESFGGEFNLKELYEWLKEKYAKDLS